MLLALLPAPGWAQLGRAAAETGWGDASPAFAATRVPAQWRDASAVMLARRVTYAVRQLPLSHRTQELRSERQRIRLLDHAAVSQYTSLTFEASPGVRLWFGVRLIKPDGTVRTLTTRNATVVAPDGQRGEQIHKLALPGLAPGDILDYFVTTRTTAPAARGFAHVLHPLAGPYPIVYQTFTLRAGAQCTINAAALDGTVPNGAAPWQTRVTRAGTEWTLTDTNRAPAPKPAPWTFANRSEPLVNFRAFWVGRRQPWMRYWLADPGAVRVAVPPADWLAYAHWVSEAFVPDPRRVAAVLTTLERDFSALAPLTDSGRAALARAAYLALRQQLFVPATQLIWQRGGSGGSYGMRNVEAIQILRAVLRQRGVAHQLVLAAPRDLCEVSQVVLPQDLTFLLRVPTGDTAQYLGEVTAFGHPGQLGQLLEGTPAYAVDPDASPDQRRLYSLVLPTSTADQNAEVVTLRAEVVGSRLRLQRTVATTGYARARYADAVTTGDYLRDTRATTYALPNATPTDTAAASEGQRQADRARLTHLANQVAGDFETPVAHYQQFTLQTTGLWPDQPALTFADEFELDECVIPTGQNWLVRVGRLLSKQVDLPPGEVPRQTTVHMPCARSFTYVIHLRIPEGYVVSGMEQLNQRIQNPAGGFVSTATLAGDELTIVARKYYAHPTELAQDWAQLVAFTDAARAFGQRQLLLRKIPAPLVSR